MTDAPAEVVTLSIETPKGQEVWERTPDVVKEHLRQFGLARPGFKLGLYGDMMLDDRPAAAQGQTIRYRQDPLHQYQAGTIYVMRHLPRRPGLQILDIGSPVETTITLCAYGEVTKLDIRPQAYRDAVMPFQSLTGSATQIPILDERADVVVSNCVLCHVGDGRYGDALDVDGDLHMLRECTRVVRPGGLIILGLGPMGRQAALLFNTHRVYSAEWAHRLVRWAGLKVLDLWVYAVGTGLWQSPDLMVEQGPSGGYYGFATLMKPVVGTEQHATPAC